MLSGLLGIGSGAVKVLAMDQVMRLPFKVSTTTSNFMIGVTAAASAGIYLSRGYIDPGLAHAGHARRAERRARRAPGSWPARAPRVLRLLFTGIIVVLALRDALQGHHGGAVTGPRVPARWTDEQVERFVGNLLRYGVLSAALVALIGGVFYLARFGGTAVHYHEFKGEPPG